MDDWTNTNRSTPINFDEDCVKAIEALLSAEDPDRNDKYCIEAIKSPPEEPMDIFLRGDPFQ